MMLEISINNKSRNSNLCSTINLCSGRTISLCRNRESISGGINDLKKSNIDISKLEQQQQQQLIIIITQIKKENL